MASKRRVNLNRERIMTAYEFEGSAVRRLEESPDQGERRRRRRKRSASTVRRYSLSRGYTIFLAAMCTVAAILCIMLLSMKATVTIQYETIAEMESEYSELRSNNDSKYNQVVDSVSIEEIRDAAENEFGMSYASEDQIIYYDLTDESYVKQYGDVPTE